MDVRVKINGVSRTLTAEPGERVADLLYRSGYLTVRQGCDREGACGSCSVLLNGKLVNSCILLPEQVEGKEILTVEGLSKGRGLHPIQEAFLAAGIVQCGYCSPAMILAVKELLDRNAAPSKEEVVDALSGVFCRCTGYEQVFDAVKSAGECLGGKETSCVSARYREDLRVVGKSMPKVDGPKLVKGEPAYVEDMVKPGSLHLKVLYSPHAHAIIRSIDTSRAEALEGVAIVLTHKNVPATYYNSAGQGYPEPSPYDRRLIDEKVRFVGDRVAAVAAATPQIAEEALKLIDVEYEVLPAVFSPFDAMKEGAPQIHDRDISIDPLPIGQDPARNVAAFTEGGIGDLEKGFGEADVVIEREYQTGHVHSCPVEPHVVYTYMEGGRLIIRASTQVPWHLRRIVARILGIRENKIRVIKERVGGGFGVKQDMVLEELAAFVTWQTGLPVYFRFTREEEFVSSRTRHPMHFLVKLGAKKDGTLTAIYLKETADTGAYGVHCLTVPMNACSKSLPLLRCPNVHFVVRVYYTNNVIAGAYQGYGAPQGSFAVQTALAELAGELGMDHVELLRKNHVRKDDVLEILRCLGEGQEGIPQPVSSCGLPECLEEGCRLSRWGEREESGNGDVKIGKGVAIIQQGSGLPGIDSANATVQMMGDGTFMILMGGTDLGTGLDTLAVKVAAEILKVEPETFSIISSDTDVTPFDVGAYASSGTYFSGMAVHKAAESMREKILAAASHMLKEPASQIALEYPGKARGKSRSLTFAEIAHETQCGDGCGQLIAQGNFTTDKSPIPYGAHFAKVAVNTRTGKVEVLAYHALQDCGTPINPELALGQIYGGVLKSLGHTLYEEMKFDGQGRCLTPSFLDYKVPMISDLPGEFVSKIIYVEEALGPFGAKSVSEISTNGAAPAVASAIHDATGVWMRSWPFTAEKVLEALEAARQEEAAR